MLNIVVCVSGGGTNLQAIIDGVESGKISNTRIVGVLSNNQNARALERAEKHKIPAVCVSPKQFDTREAFHQALLHQVEAWNPDLVVLAGFLVAIPPAMTAAYENRIINIHPSLIPAFCGVGYYGLKVHEKALEKGVKVTGATVHFVDGGMDTGAIIDQKAVRILDGDTPEVLQKRVMEEAEWILLPQAIDDIANGRLSIRDGKVIRNP